MPLHNIAQPAVAMMLLTALVWVYMFIRRNSYILSNRVKLQNIRSPELINAVIPEEVNRPSNNLKNLFELPVIFYALCALLAAIQNADANFVTLAWAYVGLRAAHSIIHCTFNLVLVRFIPYLLSSIILGVMIVKLAIVVF
jgi:hypothetical protein